MFNFLTNDKFCSSRSSGVRGEGGYVYTSTLRPLAFSPAQKIFFCLGVLMNAAATTIRVLSFFSFYTLCCIDRQSGLEHFLLFVLCADNPFLVAHFPFCLNVISTWPIQRAGMPFRGITSLECLSYPVSYPVYSYGHWQKTVTVVNCMVEPECWVGTSGCS